jgi:hypothetical protein
MKLAYVVFAVTASLALHLGARVPAVQSPCRADSSYQRLRFWVGDWEILDSTGAHYANQRVHEAADGCAFTAEWEGRDGNNGLNLSAYDGATGEWRQVYVSNQVPAPLGVQLRRSDATYRGAGVRFIALVDPPTTQRHRSRITIAPLDGNAAVQLFEQSVDAGKTWTIQFTATHLRR